MKSKAEICPKNLILDKFGLVNLSGGMHLITQSLAPQKQQGPRTSTSDMISCTLLVDGTVSMMPKES